MASLPDDPTAPLSRDPSEVALREVVRHRRRKDQVAMKESWRRLLVLEWPRFRAMVAAKRHDQLPGGRVPPDAQDDVAQQAFMRLHDWLELEGDSMGEVRAIMRRAVNWAVLDHMREHVKHESRRAGSFDEQDPANDGPGAFVRRVEQELAERLGEGDEARARAGEIGRAVDELPDRERRVLVMRLAGLTSKEVAAELGITSSNVDQIHSRTLRRLRTDLEDLG